MKALKYLSPRYVLLLAGILLFGFTLVPPRIYERYIHEPNLMFGNFLLYVFLFGCLIVLRIGIGLSRRMPRLRVPRIRRLFVVGPFAYLFVPVCFALGLLALTITVVLGNSPDLLALAMSGQGGEVKRAMNEAAQGAFNGSLPLAMGVSWWSLARYFGLRQYMPRVQAIFVSSLVALLVLALLLAAALMMSRFVLIPTLFGMFVIYLRHKISEEGVKVGKIIVYAMLALAIVVIVFGVFAAMRNGGERDAIIQSFIGYGPASLNHLAALLDGRMETGSLGQYLRQENFGFFFKFPFMIRLLGQGDTFAVATQSIFTHTWSAGLNGSYIWFTSFGEIVAELHALSVFYLLTYGCLVGRAWHAFARGTIFGIVMYPWAAFGLLFSFGSNIFANGSLSVLLMLALVIWIYSELVGVKREVCATASNNLRMELS